MLQPSSEAWSEHLRKLRRPGPWLGVLSLLAGGLPMIAFTSATPALSPVFAICCLLTVALSGELDQSVRARRGLGPRWLVLARNFAGVLLALVTISVAADFSISPTALMVTWLVAPPLFLVGSEAAHRMLDTGKTRTIVVGSGEVAQRAVETTRRHPELGIEIVAMVDDPLPADPDPALVVGHLDELPKLLAELEARSVLVGFSIRRDSELVDILRRCDDLGVEVAVLPRLFDLIGPPPSDLALGALGTVAFRGRPPGFFERALKRAFDLGVVLALAVPTALVVGIAAVALKLSDPGPVFFRHRRVGRKGRVFEVLKLRTMVVDAEARMAAEVQRLKDEGATSGEIAAALKQENDPRVTPLGRLLRKTSIDELPQLWNVFTGEMSIVGPRPLPLDEAEGLSGWELARLDMRPGITGLWQVVGRSSLPWEERMQLDYVYVRNWSLATDLSVIARTLSTVVQARGAV